MTTANDDNTLAVVAEIRQRVAFGQSTLTFTICRADEYEGDVYTKNELTNSEYIVFISNGDSYLLQTVEQIEALISDELFLHGYSDDGQEAT